LLFGTRSPAAQRNPRLPIGGDTLDVAAERMDLDMGGRALVLAGNVSARLGELEIACARIDVQYDEMANVRSARGSGGVRAKFRGVQASASTLGLDMKKRTLSLAGRVRVLHGSGSISAESASLDLTTHKLSLTEVRGSIPIDVPAPH
jgi:lipopolysaccharide export system protein LptA